MTSSLLKSVEKLEINFPLQLIMVSTLSLRKSLFWPSKKKKSCLWWTLNINVQDKSAKGTLVLSLVIAILIRTEAKTGKNVFNVVDYGAVGDGNTNDTQVLFLLFMLCWVTLIKQLEFLQTLKYLFS